MRRFAAIEGTTSGALAQDGELKEMAVNVAQAMIQLDRPLVLRAHVKKWRLAARQNPSHDFDH